MAIHRHKRLFLAILNSIPIQRQRPYSALRHPLLPASDHHRVLLIHWTKNCNITQTTCLCIFGQRSRWQVNWHPCFCADARMLVKRRHCNRIQRWCLIFVPHDSIQMVRMPFRPRRRQRQVCQATTACTHVVIRNECHIFSHKLAQHIFPEQPLAQCTTSFLPAFCQL